MGAQKKPPSRDRKIGRDPDEWSPPPPKHNSKARKARRSNNNNHNKGSSRNYDKPWQVNNNGKKDKKKKSGSDGDESPFLLHCYPDGKGPDAELIKMLERDMLDRNPNVTFEDIASLKDAK